MLLDKYIPLHEIKPNNIKPMEKEELDSGKNKIIPDGTSKPTQNNPKEKLAGKIFPKLNNYF